MQIDLTVAMHPRRAKTSGPTLPQEDTADVHRAERRRAATPKMVAVEQLLALNSSKRRKPSSMTTLLANASHVCHTDFQDSLDVNCDISTAPYSAARGFAVARGGGTQEAAAVKCNGQEGGGYAAS